MLRNYYTCRCQTPLPTRTAALELTCASPRPAIRVRDRSHARGIRTRTVPGHTAHQLANGQPYTGRTVTFSRPAASRSGPRSGHKEDHGRSVLWTTYGRRSLGRGHHPHGVGAGADCALGRPSWAATLAHRPRSCGNQGHFLTPAASSIHEGDPMSSPRRLRHPRPCHWAGHRCRRLIERPQPSWPIRVGPHRTCGRCAQAS